MSYFAGLDVSLRSVAVCVIDKTGKIVTERVLSVESEPVSEIRGRAGVRQRSGRAIREGRRFVTT